MSSYSVSTKLNVLEAGDVITDLCAFPMGDGVVNRFFITDEIPEVPPFLDAIEPVSGASQIEPPQLYYILCNTIMI